MPLFNNVLAGAAGQSSGVAAADVITRSLRFNSGDSAKLSKTFSSEGNRRTFTFSCWVKRTKLARESIFSAGSSVGSSFGLEFNGSDKLDIYDYNGSFTWRLETSAVFRDVGSFFSLILSVDTTQTTASNRVKVYINGSQVTDFATSTYPSLNHESFVNDNVLHTIGSYQNDTFFSNCLLSDVQFIDGQQIAPTDLGEFHATTGVWNPIEFTGSYTSTGSTTGTLLNYNSNTSLPTYSDQDSNSGTPSVYQMENAFDGNSSTYANMTYLNGRWTRANFGQAITNVTRIDIGWDGEGDVGYNGSVVNSTVGYTGSRQSLTLYNNSGSPITLNNIHMVSQPGNGVCRLYDITITTTTQSATELTYSSVPNGPNGFHLDFSNTSSNASLGYDAAGSNNWAVNNLVAVTNANSKGFKAVTYTGTGSTQTVTGLDFQPDFVWIKSRTSTADHELYDSARGATKRLFSSLTNAETTRSDGLTSFNSNGFTLGGHGGSSGSSTNYVAWCWKANGTASSNTDGSLTAYVSANDAYGFSIIQFLGNATSGATVGHGLSSAPELVIGKNRGGGDNWFVWFKAHSPSAQSFLKLNSDAAEQTTQYIANNTAPSNSVITLGSDYGWNSSQSPGSILYAWRSISGFSKIGSYTGNGNTSGNGPRVELGFKPAFLMVKGANVQSGWRIFDSTRDPGGQFQKRLYADGSSTESTNSTQYVNYDDTGFDVEASGSLSTYNVSGKTYVYMAFAQDPRADAIDSLFDAPVNGTQSDTGAGGEISGCYATLNSLQSGSNVTLSNGNLEYTSSSTATHANKLAFSTIGVSSGKWYAEATCTAKNDNFYIGVMGNVSENFATPYTTSLGFYATGWGYWSDGDIYNNGSIIDSAPASVGVGDVVGVALDVDNRTVTFYKNGVQQGSTATSLTANATWMFAVGAYKNSTIAWNFGQRAFAYQNPGTNRPAATFKALCTTNLSTPAIVKGSSAFDIDLYTGTGSTHERSEFSFSPDLVWIKQRNTTRNNLVFDTVRGANKFAVTNSSGTPGTGSGMVTSFDSDGFTVGNSADVNQSSGTFCAWCWDAGSSTVSNTDGTITSSVRASQTNGISIVSYTGNGSSSATVGHGLNAKLGMLIHKRTDNTGSWKIKHTSLSTNHQLLFDTAASVDVTGNHGGGMGDLTSSSTFGFAQGLTNVDNVNGNGPSYINYCFAPVEGFSSFGSYVGNGLAEGSFVFTGMRPKYIMIKGASAGGSNYNWAFVDTERAYANVANHTLAANLSNGESYFGNGANVYGASNKIDILSNGFKLRESGAWGNSSGVTYIYAAFAEHPFKYARAR